MTALPPAADFTGSSVTEGQFKTAITSLRSFLSELIGTDGSDTVAAQTALKTILCDSLAKTGAYTVVAADKGKVITATGTWSLSLTAAATLGDAFHFALWNGGAGTITIDPNASETVDGATTLAVAAGRMCLVYCNGTSWGTTYTPPPTTPTDLYKQIVSTDIAAASGSTYIPWDNTVPTVSEGTQIATLNITPADTSNLVEVSATFTLQPGTNTTNTGQDIAIAALFRGSTCIAAQQVGNDAAAAGASVKPAHCVSFHLIDAPASASAVTYSIRVGCNLTTGYPWSAGNYALFAGAGDENQLILKEIAA